MTAKRKNIHRKKPIISVVPDPKKEPRGLNRLGPTDDLPPAWQFNILDFEGRWGWDNVDVDSLKNIILPHLADIEKINWAQMGQTGSHPISKDKLIPDAQKRLREIQQEDIDSLYSLAIRGKERIWGIRIANILKILWWDPNHEVYPSRKRHT